MNYWIFRRHLLRVRWGQPNCTPCIMENSVQLEDFPPFFLVSWSAGGPWRASELRRGGHAHFFFLKYAGQRWARTFSFWTTQRLARAFLWTTPGRGGHVLFLSELRRSWHALFFWTTPGRGGHALFLSELRWAEVGWARAFSFLSRYCFSCYCAILGQNKIKCLLAIADDTCPPLSCPFLK